MHAMQYVVNFSIVDTVLKSLFYYFQKDLVRIAVCVLYFYSIVVLLEPLELTAGAVQVNTISL